MARFPTASNIDNSLCVNVSSFRKWGDLKKDYVNATYSWTTHSKSKLGSIGYVIKKINSDRKILTLSYTFKGEKIKYDITLVSFPTNIGNGKRWYFICPSTKKRCTKLISPNDSKYFLHRTAYPNLLYFSQKRSKEYRRLDNTFGWLFERERLEKELEQPYKKRHYKGNPTPVAAKLKRLTSMNHFKKQMRLLAEFNDTI